MAENSTPPLHSGWGSTPVPDPTVMTNQAVERAIGALKETLLEKIEGQKNVLETRLDGMSEAVKLLQTIMDRNPAQVDVKISNLERLHDERFKGLETRILERDDNVTQAKADAKVGIDAALASAEKLVGQSNDSFKELFEKAERSTEKLLDKQDENQKNSTAALEDKISGLKERLDRIEGAAVGIVTQKGEAVQTASTAHTSNAWILSLVVAGISMVGLIALLIRDFAR